jgi:hypothetical protein
MRKAGLLVLICLGSLIFAQEAEQGERAAPKAVAPETAAETAQNAAENGEQEKPRGLSPEFIMDRDLATASLPELADWCRSLRLSGEGSREELSSRLREYYKLGGPASGADTPGGAASGETETASEETASEETASEGTASEGTAPEGTASGEGTASEGTASEGTASGEGTASEEGASEGTEKRELVITIESAQSTEYFTVESVHEEYARLRGGVSVSLRDGEIVHRIQAEEILYNRTRKIMTASGGVVYVKEDGDKVETFHGDGITVNLDNWSTAFMKGISDHEISDGVSTYRFEGEVISRSGENSTVLRRAKITNPKEPEAFWSIDASKLWLLPGSDWAVLNAVVKVGEIPVLWLPAFYYPANEIIFHPVLGIRTREGSFVQTTTYLLGRPKALPLSEESSITTIMGSGEGMEKVREGVFLRSTGRRARDENEVKLSLLADAYVNL